MKKVLLFMALIFFSGLVSAEIRFQYWDNNPRQLSIDPIQSELRFLAKANGVVEVWNNGVHQGNFTLGVYGKIGETTQKRLLNDFTWDWNITEKNSQKVSIHGFNNDLQFPMWIDLNVEDGELPLITIKAKNNTGYNITEMQLYLIVDIDQESNPYIYYEKTDGNYYVYDFTEDIHRTQADTNFQQYYNRVKAPFFRFIFNQLINSNYYVTRAFFGNINHLDSKLPDTNGYVIGFSKGTQVFPNGVTVEVTPRMTMETLCEGAASSPQQAQSSNQEKPMTSNESNEPMNPLKAFIDFVGKGIKFIIGVFT